MATKPAMLKMLNSRKAKEFTPWEHGLIYALGLGEKEKHQELARLCLKVGFTEKQIDDEAKGLSLKAA